MLTLITGTPGAGKSLYTVWEIARHVPGSTLEVDGEPRPRKLYSNIKQLDLEHQHIDAEDMNRWHTWAGPGDVIIFDEVQEVWRPRGMGVKVPDCIAALETHRHKGVDIVLITQGPNLVDANIRKLVNQHLHCRRLTKRMAMVYEWDYCSDPKAIKGAIQSKLWRHPVKGYALYKSAQAHTKPTARMPRIAFLGFVAVAAAIFLIPNAVSRIFNRGQDQTAQQAIDQSKPKGVHSGSTVAGFPAPPASAPVNPFAPASAPGGAVRGPLAAPQRVAAGCITKGDLCACMDAAGAPVDRDEGMCQAQQRGPALQLDALAVQEVEKQPRLVDPGDAEVLAWMAKQRSYRAGL